MKAVQLQNVVGGIIQEDTPVRARHDTGSDADKVAWDISRIEVVDGVAYLIINHNSPHIVPESHK